MRGSSTLMILYVDVIGAGLKGRRLRQFGRKFTDHLKQLSRTQSRGGITDWIALESRRSKQRKRRVSLFA